MKNHKKNDDNEPRQARRGGACLLADHSISAFGPSLSLTLRRGPIRVAGGGEGGMGTGRDMSEP